MSDPRDQRPVRQLRRENLAIALEDERDSIARRDFIKLMGAAFGLAGLSACTRAPAEEIVPYVVQPPEVTPGRARFYASAFTLDGYATGVLVESHEGRPTKIEGNPDHPASLGATGVYEQASVLSLYDPSRASAAASRTGVVPWKDVATAIARGPWTDRGGRGLYLLLEPTSSPTAVALLAEIRRRWPEAAIHFHAPGSPTNAWQGARMAFGHAVEPRYDLSRADVIVALDSDFLARGPASLRNARQFADRRRLTRSTDGMNRLYAFEPLPTPTGTTADHRIRVRASDVQAVAAALLHAIGAPQLAGGVPAPLRAAAMSATPGSLGAIVASVAKDLAVNRGRSLVITGDGQPPIVHAMAHAINAALGNLDTTVDVAPSPILDAGEASHGLEGLANALDAGKVDTLLVLGTNAVYTAPADRPLAIGRARQSAYLGMYDDETAHACTYAVGQAHPLESWGDARAFDGTVSVVQPLIEPLHSGRTVLDVLAVLAGQPLTTTSYDLVRHRFGNQPETAWRRALMRGVTEDAAIPVVAGAAGALQWRSLADTLARAASAAPSAAPGGPPASLELIFPLDPHVHDGRFTNNAWLLELPGPISKLTWTNAATLAPETAARLSLTNGDEVEVRFDGRTVKAPVLVMPGQAVDTVALALGWGRRGGEELARDVGVNAYALRTTHASYAGGGATLRTTGTRRDLPVTQLHRGLEGRDEDILHHVTLDEYRRHPTKSAEKNPSKKKPLALYGLPPKSRERQWGMAIDLSICTGCSACVVACQAENNVPTVGPESVMHGRAMHWLRIDSYFTGNPNDPDVQRQPMLCQHCEKAPCEYVCPVNATVHSDDGLNEMVYNRCVGTRFCSNNCPYKVRRFNWFDYHHDESATEQLVHNPDVTVRERGVMEKCTFCVQRIREDEIRGRTDRGAHGSDGNRAKRPPVQSACQQACPTRAIVFGDLLEAGSEVAGLHQNERAFAALEDLGTIPRVRYLASVKNKNPEVA